MLKRQAEALIGGAHLAEAPFAGVGQFLAECSFIERRPSLCLRVRLRPDNRYDVAVILRIERQQRERAIVQESLASGVGVMFAHFDDGDNGRLPGRAQRSIKIQKIAHTRARAVGANQERTLHFGTCANRHMFHADINVFNVLAKKHLDTRCFDLCPQACLQVAHRRHESKLRSADIGRIKRYLRGTEFFPREQALELPVMMPSAVAKDFKKILPFGGERDHACIKSQATASFARRGALEKGDRIADSFDSERCRRADEAAADNEHLKTLSHSCHP